MVQLKAEALFHAKQSVIQISEHVRI